VTLAHQLALATLVVGVTVVVHLAGLALLLAILRRYRRASRRYLVILLNGGAILVAAFGLFALHSAEIWIWQAFTSCSALSQTSSSALFLDIDLCHDRLWRSRPAPGAARPRCDRGRERYHPDRLVHGLLFLDRRSHETPRTQFGYRSWWRMT